MTKTLKEQAKAHTPKHGLREYRGYQIKYPMGRFFIYDGENMVWSAESMADCEKWIDEQYLKH